MRYLTPFLDEDLENRKMVFLGGPRQVGKTTLAISYLKPPNEENPVYLNWDDSKARDLIQNNQITSEKPTLVLDEIHKFGRWRNLVKGIYDTRKSKQKIIVTGSARLDYYSKGGDSLQGRYHYYRLHPFSLDEIKESGGLENLLKYGGFPEPFFKQSERFCIRWQRERRERVIFGDLRDLERVRDVSLVDLLAGDLPRRVGSPLSISNLRNLLNTSHESIEKWVQILERLYFCFRISPYGAPKIRAVKKEQKLYMWDWTLVEDSGARFENFVASCLLKYCHKIEDTEGYEMELRFLRDTDKREVDFVVLKDKKAIFAVECKSGEKAPSSSAYYFKQRTQIPLWYQVHLGKRDYGSEIDSIRVLPFEKFIKEMAF